MIAVGWRNANGLDGTVVVLVSKVIAAVDTLYVLL